MTAQRIIRPASAFSITPAKGVHVPQRKIKPEPELFVSKTREWRSLREFPDYEISNDGRLRRLTPGSNMRAGTLIRVTMSANGYPKYGLTNADGRRVHKSAHQLVAVEFLDPCPVIGLLVLHTDDNRLNCCHTNLRWGTGVENVVDAKRNGLWPTGDDHSSTKAPWARPRGEAHAAAKLTDGHVRAILADVRNAPAIAAEYGVDSALIYRIRAGKVWKHITNPEYKEMLDTGVSKQLHYRPRRPRQHDHSHLSFIRSLRCCVCGAENPDAAHIRSASPLHGKPPSGLGEKPSDKWCTPLCRTHHEDQHRGNEMLWWKSKSIDPFALALSLYSATGDLDIADGIVRSNIARASALTSAEREGAAL
jgi:hypothetical protein